MVSFWEANNYCFELLSCGELFNAATMTMPESEESHQNKESHYSKTKIILVFNLFINILDLTLCYIPCFITYHSFKPLSVKFHYMYMFVNFKPLSIKFHFIDEGLKPRVEFGIAEIFIKIGFQQPSGHMT